MGGLFLSSILAKVDGRGEAVGAEVATGMRKVGGCRDGVCVRGSGKGDKMRCVGQLNVLRD